MAAIAAAGISAGASLLSGITGGKAAKSAAKIQADAYKQGVAEQRNEFNTVQANNQPYMQAGGKGLDSLMTLLGLNGNNGQQSAIDALKASPLFTSQYGTGVDTILQNASATGGLRGGNTQNSLADFGSKLLSSVIQNQIGNYGGLVNVGQAAASGTNAGALQTGANISNLLAQQGQAGATSALQQGALTNQTINGVGSSLADYLNRSSGGGSYNINMPALQSGTNSALDQIIGQNAVGW